MRDTLTEPEQQISEHECEAMQALDDDPGYSRSEIGFIFECSVKTIRRHADRECHHVRSTHLKNPGAHAEAQREYSDAQLRTAYRVVWAQVPYERMSLPVYDQYRPEDYPRGETITNRFGSWTAAREAVFGGE